MKPRLRSLHAQGVSRPWHMYPLGILFGLGFDTATEIALLVLAASTSFSGLPFYAILCLPVLFAAGMSLLDTLDGAFMSFAYGWALARPVRRLYYNVTVTTLSVTVALGIGSIELAVGAGRAARPRRRGFPLDRGRGRGDAFGYGVDGAVRADLDRRGGDLAPRPHRAAVGVFFSVA